MGNSVRDKDRGVAYHRLRRPDFSCRTSAAACHPAGMQSIVPALGVAVRRGLLATSLAASLAATSGAAAQLHAAIEALKAEIAEAKAAKKDTSKLEESLAARQAWLSQIEGVR